MDSEYIGRGEPIICSFSEHRNYCREKSCTGQRSAFSAAQRVRSHGCSRLGSSCRLLAAYPPLHSCHQRAPKADLFPFGKAGKACLVFCKPWSWLSSVCLGVNTATGSQGLFNSPTFCFSCFVCLSVCVFSSSGSFVLPSCCRV